MIGRSMLCMSVVMTMIAAVAALSLLLPNDQQAAMGAAGQAMSGIAGKVMHERSEEAGTQYVEGATHESGQQFVRGDIFAASERYVEWYHSDGTFVGDLDTGQIGFLNAGMAFDAGGNLYVTGFDSYTVTKFDISGTLLGTFGSGYSGHPESIVFDCDGSAYVGTVPGSDNDILKFDPTGRPLERYDVERERQGSDWIDLAHDQCTMFYTSEGRRIMRYDVCTGTQIADFALLPAGTRLWELHILPNGNVLVAATGAIYRLDSTGTVVMTYTHPTGNHWRNLALAPDGRSFWAGIWDGNIYAFDIATGAVLTSSIDRGFRRLRGLEVFGGPAAATSRCCVDLVDKRVVGLDQDLVAPNYATFTIAITNTGLITIDVLPLLDLYDPGYLSLEEATPVPDVVDETSGRLTWYNLTMTTSHGFGRNLPPGEAFSVNTVFRIVRHINRTTNTAIVTGTRDVYGHLAGEVQDDVVIMDVPTAIEVLYFRAVAEEAAVRLEWATAAEWDCDGFHIYRGLDTDYDDAQIVHYAVAQGPGSTYSYMDRDLEQNQVYWYWLAEVSASEPGHETLYGPVWSGVGPRALPVHVYLPLICKGWE